MNIGTVYLNFVFSFSLLLELLGPRDPYYDRRSDPYGGPRDYDRDWERDPYREKPPLDYERDRYERDRYLRDER